MGVLSAVLMFFDSSFSPVRNVFATVAAPLFYIVDLPKQLMVWGGARIQSREVLFRENQSLKNEVFILKGQLQTLINMKVENEELLNLLGTEQKIEGRKLVAEIIQVATDPFTHEIVINKGALDGVYKGQAVVDAYGVMGQVIRVTPLTSRVLLITDTRHSIPIRSERSGERAVAYGRGDDLNVISLQYVRSTADFQEGDVLLSSGIGERFPSGYPVAVVERIKTNSDSAYMLVEATTIAHLSRSGQVLLIWPESLPEPTELLHQDEPKSDEIDLDETQSIDLENQEESHDES